MSSFIIQQPISDDAIDLETTLLELDRQQRLVQIERRRLEHYEAQIERRRWEIIARSRQMYDLMIEREQDQQFLSVINSENILGNIMDDFSAWQQQRQRQQLIQRLLLGEQDFNHHPNGLSIEQLFGISSSKPQRPQIQKPYNQSSSFLLAPEGKRGSRRRHSQPAIKLKKIHISGGILEKTNSLKSVRPQGERLPSLLESLQCLRSFVDGYHSEISLPNLEPHRIQSLERAFEKAIDDIIAVDIEPEGELRSLKMNVLQSAEEGLEKAATMTAGEVDKELEPAIEQTANVDAPNAGSVNETLKNPSPLDSPQKTHKVTLEEVPDPEYQ
ncbi:hypothetical protein NEOLI_003832 [Neolecta irregularis DAH-3]|uniref:Uncharacterized protein n=1 Tax=Neolecta irregularis (strain DAH-3) TaxID=1198029 RepID=A0A1U7LP23_NEOID|nr:hypothetical protein NEOLI_003832 [Neolecta irregularis DAH-3]|eukprot:OLL24405.1 hypothetical protein NEOLI_003832 [Neolecta irregularis DAH-3]